MHSLAGCKDGTRIVILLCPVYMFYSILYGGVALYRVVAWNTGDELISYVKSNGFIFFLRFYFRFDGFDVQRGVSCFRVFGFTFYLRM